MNKVYIIAEAGVNHNGDISLAKKMIDAACDFNADAVKFQTYKAENVMTAFAPKAAYQLEETKKEESQLEMVRKYELDRKSHEELITYCRERRLTFLSTPHDLGSIDLLDELGIDIFKIPSGEITDLPYLRKVGRLKKKVILSTGMADMYEINEALKILRNSGTPKKNITVLHCNTQYPTPITEVNLLAMCKIRDIFDVNVGYSDHTLGIEVSVAAVALGATIIEKHFTLDRSMSGPDHKASLEPKEFKLMVQSIRNIEKALGNGQKVPSASELKNKEIVRKSIVASMPIMSGEVFTESNITVKRPMGGMSPMKWDEVIGKNASKDFDVDDFITI